MPTLGSALARLSGLRLEPRGGTCGRSPGLEPAGAYVARDERPPGRDAWDVRAGGGRATALVPCDTATSERSTCAMTADSTASAPRASAPRGDVLRVPKPASEPRRRVLVETGLSSSSSLGVNMEKSASLELRPGVCDSPAAKGLVELG